MNQPLLSYDSIERIRQYVQIKFSHLPKEKHAEIVADAIAKVVENQLPSFKRETKKTITNYIIKHIFVNQKRPLLLQDIVHICEHQPLTNDERDKFTQWRKEHQAKKEITAIKQLAGKSLEQTKYEVAAAYTAITQPRDLKKSRRKTVSLYYTLGFILLFSVIVIGHKLMMLQQETIGQTIIAQESVEPHSESAIIENLPSNELPEKYQFVEFDKHIIMSYLNTRNSLLVEEPYFSAIYNTAYDFNIHPALLFAITGQEQGFVPRDHDYAHSIVQNPFNVFYSWQDYNTNIEDTTAIAARTIVNLSKDRPHDIDAIKWINRKYAEDEKWHEGVSSLFHSIVNHEIIE